MALDPEGMRGIVAQTAVIRAPKQAVATFGVTTIEYYVVTEPIYDQLLGEMGLRAPEGGSETVVRRGTVTSERPQIVTPYYLMNLFRGFAHGEDFAHFLVDSYGLQAPGLMYSYRHELQETSIVSDALEAVAGRLADDLEAQGKGLAAIVRGVDHYWDISVMKLIYELTMRSLRQNVSELDEQGLLRQEHGLPRAIRTRIDEMFAATAHGDLNPAELKAELDRWGIFHEYEDRFFDLFRR